MRKRVFIRGLSAIIAAITLISPVKAKAIKKSEPVSVDTIIYHVESINLKKDESYKLYRTISENNNLDNITKCSLYYCVEMYDDNKYADYESLNDRINDLTVDYKRRYSKDGYTYKGVYTNSTNTLTYLCENFRNPEIEEYIAIHESTHIFFPCNNMPRYFCEGIATTLTTEYTQKDPFEVEQLLNISSVASVKILIELLGTDIINKAVAENDPIIIIKALSKIYGDDEMAKDIFYSLSSIGGNPKDRLAPYFKAKFGDDWLLVKPEVEELNTMFKGMQFETWPNEIYFNTNSSKNITLKKGF